MRKKKDMLGLEKHAAELRHGDLLTEIIPKHAKNLTKGKAESVSVKEKNAYA